MDLLTTENSSIQPAIEAPKKFEIEEAPAFLPTVILPEVYRVKSGKIVYPRCSKEAKALYWALERIAGWQLPGKEHVEEYFRGMYRRNFRPKTYGGALTPIHAFLTCVKKAGKSRLEEVTKGDIEAFIEHEQDRGLKLSTVRTRLHCVNAFLGYAMNAGIISSDVLARRIRLKRPETLPRAMEPDDVKRLLSVIDNPRDRAMVLVLLRTGMRIGELLNTKMVDLHLRERRIDIYEGEKNRLGRVVYLSDDALQALKVWIKIRDPQKEFLFHTPRTGTMCYAMARLIFKDYLIKAGLEHKGHSLHALRHTFASDLLNAGMRIECLQPLLGHSSLDVTRRYARLTDKTREEEYFRAMTIIEREQGNGRDRLDYTIPALPEEKERLTEHC